MSELDHIRRALELLKELVEHVDDVGIHMDGVELRCIEEELTFKLRKAEERKCQAVGWNPHP